MGKKWKRLLVQRRANGRVDMPTVRSEPVVSNSEMIEKLEVVSPTTEPEPEVIEEVISSEPEVVEEESVTEAPKPKRRRSTRFKKSTSEA